MTDIYNEPFLANNQDSLTSHLIDTQEPSTNGTIIPADVILQDGAKPGEYVSRQRARETTTIRIFGIFRVQWLMLLFICFLTFGSYWVYDQPGALLNEFELWFPDFSVAKNEIFYSVYSYPNTILPFFSGIIIDQVLGVRWSSLLFISLILGGDALFSLGVTLKMYPLAVVGRVIFGFGGESLTVAQNTYVLKWFAREEAAVTFALVLAFARIGTSVNFLVSPHLAEKGIPLSVWVGTGMCVLSFCMCVFAALTDRYTENRIDRERLAVIAQLSPETQKRIAEEDLKYEPVNDEVRFTDILKFPFTVALLVLIVAFFYVGILTFYTVAQELFTKSLGYSDNESDLFTSIPSFVSIVASPIFGYCIDKVGRSIYWVIGAGTIVLLGHTAFVLMAFQVEFALKMTPIPIMIWIGIGYSMGAASVWPMLPLLVRKNVLGTGFGVMTAVQNAFLAVFPQIIAALQSNSSIENISGLKYGIPAVIFMGCEIIAIVLCIVLFIWDLNRSCVLSSPPSIRDRIIKERETAEREDDAALAGNPSASVTYTGEPILADNSINQPLNSGLGY